MNVAQVISKIIFSSMILLNFSCSSTNQNLEATKVESLLPAIQEWKLPTTIIPTPTPDPNWKVVSASVIQGKEGELTIENITEGRDMSQYEQDVHYDCRQFKCNRQKFRNFIWQHWVKKKRGYTKVTYKPHFERTNHIFIEPNKQGEWKITSRSVSNEPLQNGNTVMDAVGINTVERIKIKSKKIEWELIFKNKDGEIIQKI